MKNIAIIGASGSIGRALLMELAAKEEVQSIYAFSRSGERFGSPKIISAHIELTDETSIEAAAKMATKHGPLALVIVATGILHTDEIAPEKSLRDLSVEKFERLFAINTIGPALLMKHFLPLLLPDARSVFAVLSARVGSISDNRLGGWYAYRASKAALNMLIRTASIEMRRRSKHAILVGLHPGTVDSELSRPFQGAVSPENLMTAENSARRLISVLQDFMPVNSGKCFAYDGTEVLP